MSYSGIPIRGILLLCCLAATQNVAAGCAPDFPTPSAITAARAAGTERMQVIVPSYNFTCSGYITRVSIRAASEAGDNGFVFQVWGLQEGGLYYLKHSVDTTGITLRSEEMLEVYEITVPVVAGDTIGYQLTPVGGRLHLILDNSNASQDTVYYKKELTNVPCTFSTCDSEEVMKSVGFAPLISVEFEQDDEADDYDEEGEFQCTMEEVPECDVSNIPPIPSVSPTAPISSSSLLITSVPLPTPVTPTTTTVDVPPEQEEGEEDMSEDNGNNDDSLFNLNVTTETVIVLAIGVALFIVLIVLVIVLVACICRRRKPRPYRFKSPPPNGTVIGTPVTSVSVISAFTDDNINGAAVVNDMYINSAMQVPLMDGATRYSGSNGSIDPPSTSSDCHDPDHSHRGRRMKSPLLPESPRDPLPSVRSNTEPVVPHLQPSGRTPREMPPKTQSKIPLLPPSSSAVSSRSGSNPPSNLPFTVPPPATISLQHVVHSTPPSSSLINSHPPPSSVPAIVSTSQITNSLPFTSAETTSASSTEHPRPTNTDITSSKTDRNSAHPYDHLPGGERTGSDLSNKPRPVSNSKARSSNYIYTYVPTEEQRRLVKIQNSGRYEVTDELEALTGYDRLKFFKESETYWSPATTTSGLYAQLYENKYRELPREQIIIQGEIGSGHFGSVSKGLWLLRGEGGEVMEGEGVQVAVKVVKTEAEEVQRVKLLQEAAIMGQFAHPNVVRLNGVVTVGDPTMIVLEYMPQGDLKSYLQRLRPNISKRSVPRDAPRLFIKFGKDIASGMSYLARKNFVHRDLATRNILLNHNLTCKIGDFGMARDIAGSGGGSDYYKSHGGIIPVKWTAPESLNYNKYTSASDVWSYGMVLFEIWSLGHKPFPELANPIVIALVTSKHCQAPPPGCPRPIYHLMVECWNPKDTQRPTFDCIQRYLDSPDESLLQWLASDTLPGKQAHILGAPLVEGNNLYIELQRTYQNQILAQLQSSNS